MVSFKAINNKINDVTRRKFTCFFNSAITTTIIMTKKLRVCVAASHTFRH